MYKLQLKPQQGSNVSILTSIPARCLASTSCAEQLEVHMTDSGGILAMNYDFAACPCSPEHRVSDTVPSSWSFKEVVPALVRRSRKIAPLTLLPRTEGTSLSPQAGLPSASLGKGRASAMALTAAHLHKNENHLGSCHGILVHMLLSQCPHQHEHLAKQGPAKAACTSPDVPLLRRRGGQKQQARCPAGTACGGSCHR